MLSSWVMRAPSTSPRNLPICEGERGGEGGEKERRDGEGGRERGGGGTQGEKKGREQVEEEKKGEGRG